jgi:hypothetical protein
VSWLSAYSFGAAAFEVARHHHALLASGRSTRRCAAAARGLG